MTPAALWRSAKSSSRSRSVNEVQNQKLVAVVKQALRQLQKSSIRVAGTGSAPILLNKKTYDAGPQRASQTNFVASWIGASQNRLPRPSPQC